MRLRLQNLYQKALSIAAYDTSNIEIHRVDCYQLMSWDFLSGNYKSSSDNLVERLAQIDYLSLNYIIPNTMKIMPAIDAIENVFKPDAPVELKRNNRQKTN